MTSVLTKPSDSYSRRAATFSALWLSVTLDIPAARILTRECEMTARHDFVRGVVAGLRHHLSPKRRAGPVLAKGTVADRRELVGIVHCGLSDYCGLSDLEARRLHGVHRPGEVALANVVPDPELCKPELRERLLSERIASEHVRTDEFLTGVTNPFGCRGRISEQRPLGVGTAQMRGNHQVERATEAAADR